MRSVETATGRKRRPRAAREIGVLQGERRKLELATADARRERGAAEQKLGRAEENARFARERHEAETRDAEALLEDLRSRRLTRSERDAKAERASLLTQLEAAQSATAAALGEGADGRRRRGGARGEGGARRGGRRVLPASSGGGRRGGGSGGGGGERDCGAESRARDAESGGISFDEALASAVAETARAAERNRRELARARTELASATPLARRVWKKSWRKIEHSARRRSKSSSANHDRAPLSVKPPCAPSATRASAAEADATRAETRVVELTDAAAELARALDAEREEKAERDRSAAALASGVDALRTELEETRARLERLADERDRAREEVAEARARRRASETPLSTFVRLTNPPIALPAVSPSRVDDKGPVTIPNGGAFGGGGFDVSALVESTNRRRKERARQTDAIRAAVRDAEARHAEENAKRVAELTDARERAARRSRRSPCSPPTCLTRPLPPPLTPTRPRRRADARRSTRRRRTSSGTGKRLASRERGARGVSRRPRVAARDARGEDGDVRQSRDVVAFGDGAARAFHNQRRDGRASPCFTTGVTQPRR